MATVQVLLRAAAAQRIAVRLSRRLRRLNEATFAINNALQPLIAEIARQASLLANAAGCSGSLDALCDKLVQEAGTDIGDDIALVAIRRYPETR